MGNNSMLNSNLKSMLLNFFFLAIITRLKNKLVSFSNKIKLLNLKEFLQLNSVLTIFFIKH